MGLFDFLKSKPKNTKGDEEDQEIDSESIDDYEDDDASE